MERAEELTRLLDSLVRKKAEKFPEEPFNLAISGGSSPERLFKLWSGRYRDLILWNKVSLFWVDERCVPPDDPESNYGNAKSLFLDNVSIPSEQIYRIEAEGDVNDAAGRYSKLVKSILPLKDGFPVFDLIILGIGDDGHTASIFPGQDNLLNSPLAYSPSLNPYSGQGRVTMTGGTIKAASNVLFYLKGESKSATLERLRSGSNTRNMPSSYFIKEFGEKSIYYDV